MKKIFVLVATIIIVISLVACGDADFDSAETGDDSSPNTVQEQSPSTQEQNPSTPVPTADDGATQPLFISEYIPVASSQGYFVVRNDSGNQYGLVDDKGNYILPCEYEEVSFAETKSQTMLKVMSRGSYGVFDLNGDERIPCEYTEVSLSPYTDYCYVKNFFDKMGLLDLDGNIILPIEFDMLKVSYGKTFTALKNAEGEIPAAITVYDSNAQLLKEILWDKEPVINIDISNGGNLLCVYYGTNFANTDYIAIEGSSVYGDTYVDGNRLYYFNGQDLIIRSLDTQEETVIWSFPDEKISKYSEIRTVKDYIDPVTNVESVDLYVFEVIPDTPVGEGYYLRITFGDKIETICYPKDDDGNTLNLGVYSYWDIASQFYDGVAIVFPESGYLYTINTKGEKIAEITNPYTDHQRSTILPYAAMLNNNGYYSIINSDGEMQLSKDGYSNIQPVNVSGIYAVTNQEGELGLISKYLEELVPCGSIASIESAIERPSYDEWELEAKYDIKDELYIIHSSNKWALYDAADCRLITDFVELQNEGLEQYQQILGNGGYALISESRECVYLVSFDGNFYNVYSYLNLI